MNCLSRRGLGLLLGAVLLASCERQSITSYTVPKEQPPPMPQGEMPAGHPDTAGAEPGPQLKWMTPAGWTEVPAGEFRVASFKVAGADGQQADVSVIPLPGGAGGDFSNVNRWRSQVGLDPVTEEDMKKLAQTVELGGQPASLFEQDGKNSAGQPTRILAVVQHRGGTAWFFKMTGGSALVAAQKPAFVEFLKSFQFASREVATTRPTLPTPPVAPSTDAGRPQWSPPSDWKEVSGGQFLVAKFLIASPGNSQAAVNVSSSAGDGGGLAANVNRWRKQLGLGELSGDELAKSARTIESPGGRVTFIEMNGTDARSGQPADLVGAIVLQPGHAWFYKLMGDPKVVAAQKEAFTKFVQEVKY